MSLSCGIHGFNLTFEGSQYDLVSSAIEKISSLKFVEGTHQLWWYPEVKSNAIGIKVARNDERPESLMAIPGGACDFLGSQKVQEILQMGYELRSGKTTQIDIFIDDDLRRWPPNAVEQAYRRGECFGFRVFRQIASGNFPRKLLQEMKAQEELMSVGMGSTFELGQRGQRGSGKRFKVYDKSVESNGRNNAIRYELSLYNTSVKKRADEVGKLMAFSEIEDWNYIIRRTFKGCIDFRLGSRGRGEMVREWKEIIGDVEPLDVCSKHKENQIEKTKEWLERCSPAISSVIQFLESSGGEKRVKEWIREIRENGNERMGTKHRQAIEEALARRQEKMKIENGV